MRIVIADDHALVRQGLAELVDKQTDMEVIGQADDGEKLVELARELSPDVIILDISMPNLNGIEAARIVHDQDPNVKIVILSMHSEGDIVAEALRAGCMAYVLKSSLFEEISAALRTVAKNEHYLSPQVTSVVVDDYVHRAPAGGQRDSTKLSSRERQVLQLVAEGLSTKQIALRLHISPKTAEANRHKIMEKLRVHSVAELTKYAIRKGLTSVEF